MAFDPRHRSKRSHKMPPVRLTDDERLSVEWLASRLSMSDSNDYSMSDAIRVSLGVAVKLEAEKAQQSGEPIPDAVRRVLGLQQG